MQSPTTWRAQACKSLGYFYMVYLSLYILGGIASGLFTYTLIAPGTNARIAWALFASIVWPIVIAWLLWVWLTNV